MGQGPHLGEEGGDGAPPGAETTAPMGQGPHLGEEGGDGAPPGAET
jgi:hypothetical protein